MACTRQKRPRRAHENHELALVQRQPNLDARTAIGARDDGEFATACPGSLAHAPHAMVARAGPVTGQTLAVILDRDCEFLVRRCHDNANSATATVAQCVGEGFLCDTVGTGGQCVTEGGAAHRVVRPIVNAQND